MTNPHLIGWLLRADAETDEEPLDLTPEEVEAIFVPEPEAAYESEAVDPEISDWLDDLLWDEDTDGDTEF